MVQPVRVALVRFVSTNTAPLRLALLRSAPLRLALLRSAPLRLALLRSAPLRSAPGEFEIMSSQRFIGKYDSLCLSTARISGQKKLALLRLARHRLALLRLAP